MSKQKTQAIQAAIGVVTMCGVFLTLAFGYQPNPTAIILVAIIAAADTGWILWTFRH